MHAWGAVDFRIYVATKNHDYSISAQRYGFCPHLRKLDILDFTLSYLYGYGENSGPVEGSGAAKPGAEASLDSWLA